LTKLVTNVRLCLGDHCTVVACFGLGCNAVSSGSLCAYRRNILPPSSRMKSKLSKIARLLCLRTKSHFRVSCHVLIPVQVMRALCTEGKKSQGSFSHRIGCRSYMSVNIIIIVVRNMLFKLGFSVQFVGYKHRVSHRRHIYYIDVTAFRT
jgi:hypothetical protein